MKISYAITVCNEGQEIKRLLDFLVPLIREEDEIVILQDVSKKSEEVDKVLIDFSDNIETRVTGLFEGDFADWKNTLNSHCTGDFIFQLDADEVPEKLLIIQLPEILRVNEGVELFMIPRANTVEGLTQEDVDRWRWVVNEGGLVNWPDYQGRLYKRDSKIRWEGKVHERIVGFSKQAFMPDIFYLHHDKTISKQREQNNLYSKILQKNA